MDFKEHLYTFMNREEADNLLSSFKNAPFSSFKVNFLKGEQLFEIIDKTALKPLKHLNNAYYYNKEELELGKNLLFYGGAYYIQEPAAMLAESLLNIKENDKVLDMCAAPGGKSFNALLSLNNTGLLVCNDIHNIRAKVLSSNIEKYGFKNTIVLNDDSSNYKKHFIEFFDKIILDAPCSGSGMFRKDSYSVEDWSIEKVYACKEIQLKLIEDAYEMLKGQGRLLYSTCSYSIQENEEVIIEFLNNHPDMELENIELNKIYNNSININGGLRLYPNKYDGEGQVMFVLKKNSYTNSNNKTIKRNRVGKIENDLYKFLDEIGYSYDKNKIHKINNQFYLIDFDFIEFKNVNVIRYGLHLGYIEQGRFVPSHSLAMVNDSNKSKHIELTKEQAIDYMQGLTVNLETNNYKGFAIATYCGYPLGFVKQVNYTLKNHLPKGLRVSRNLIK